MFIKALNILPLKRQVQRFFFSTGRGEDNLLNTSMFLLFQHILKKRQQKGSIYDLPNAQNYIENEVKKFDWPSYAISKHYPSQIRQDFLNICWFNIELSRIEEQVSEASLGLGKIDFWTNVIDQIFKDTPVQEPLSIALHQTCKNNLMPKYLFQKMLRSRKAQIERKTFEDINQMAVTCELNRGSQILLFLKLLRQDIDNEQLKHMAQHVGTALGILDYLKRVPYALKKYKLQLPEDLKNKHGITVNNLWDRIEGKPKEELYDLALEVAAFARQSLIKASQLQKDLPPQCFRAFLHATEGEYYLEMLEKYNFQLFEKQFFLSYNYKQRSLNTNSYIELPYRIFQNAKNKRFLKSL